MIERSRFSFQKISPIETLLSLVYPPQCTMCAVAVPARTESKLCAECSDAIRGCRQPRCRRCGGSVPPASETIASCKACRRKRLPFEQTVLLGTYEGPVREAVVAGKHHFGEPLTMSMGHLLADRIVEQVDVFPDVVAYVPSHWRRRLSRGTSPALTLAAVVGRRLNRPVRRVLRCTRHAPKQALLPAADRIKNVEGAFGVRRLGEVKGRGFLLIDDVMTTGATLAEASKTLMEAGASHVLVAATARGAGKT